MIRLLVISIKLMMKKTLVWFSIANHVVLSQVRTFQPWLCVGSLNSNLNVYAARIFAYVHML